MIETEVVVQNGHEFRRCACGALVDPAFMTAHRNWAHPNGRVVREREGSEVSDNRIRRSIHGGRER